MTSLTYCSIPAMNGPSASSPRSIRWSRASQCPVISGLFTVGSTVEISAIPFSVASRAFPCLARYFRSSSVSMIPARVAGVPSPVSRMASESSFSSSAFPAVSMAVSSVASVKRGGGWVRFFTGWASTTFTGSPRTRPGGSAGRGSPSTLFSSTFHPGSRTAVPLLSNRSSAEADRTSVTTEAVSQTKSPCHADSSRRQMRS